MIANRQQWEYYTTSEDPDLNELGKAGWELCAAATMGMGVMWYCFKRPVDG